MIYKTLIIILLHFISLQHSSAQYALVNAYPKLPQFENPVDLILANDGTNRMFLVEQTGKIYVFQNTPQVATRRLFLDLSNLVCNKHSETGLLGMALHPDFKTNKTFYVSYDTEKHGKLQSVIASFKVSNNKMDSVIPASETRLLVVDDKYSNHNGGCIVFGPDGYLYFSLGDEGSANDPHNNAQNLNSYWGKIHRINVADTSNGKKYGVPQDNPFVKTAGALGEIYAYGLRNTWRFNFDLEDNNKIWAGDVGQNNLEEVDIITKGGNYGWRVMEGTKCTPAINKNCIDTGFQRPVWTYPRKDGISITGGFVYRGAKVPALLGKYVYADYQFGNIWALSVSPSGSINKLLIPQNYDSPIRISSFAEDANKELLILSHGGGTIMRLVTK